MKIEELIRFYGMMIMIESTYGNDTHNIRAHFKQIQEKEGRVAKLGVDRFQALYRAFNASIEELSQLRDLLHIQFTKCFSSDL